MVDISARLRNSLGGRYEIERELGHGGMAHVFLARDLKLERSVAIKVLRPELSASLGSDRFLREIKIAANLQHPHIVPLYDSGQADGLLYYVMPYVEGETLREQLKREKQLPLEDALQISRDVAEALSYAHSHGVVHRDIKPENVLISGEQAMVADFGIAHAVSEAGGENLTDSGMVIGTPAYMSPEQATGEHELDSRSDIYSLGCVLYEMLAGETPFTGPSGQAIIARHVSQPPPSLRIVRPNVPLSVEQALERSLAKVPADRYATAHQFSQALTRASGTLRVRRVRRWVWATAWSTALVVVLAVGFLVVPRVFFGVDLRPGHHALGILAEGDVPAQFEYVRRAVYDAVRHVPGITLEESTRISNERLRLGEPRSLDDWLAIGRAVKASRIIILSESNLGDSTEIVAELYDVRTGEALGSETVTVASGTFEVTQQISHLVARLFDTSADIITLATSESDEATEALIAGEQKLGQWDLVGAEHDCCLAADLDPEYAPAQLRCAQVRLWGGEPAHRWRTQALRAVAHLDGLAPSDTVHARALLDMAEQRFPQACELYQALVDEDPTSFEALIGLAECHARDRIVVRDDASPSRWAFRSSYGRAIDAYERAFRLVSSYGFTFRQQAFLHLEELLFVEANQLRGGMAQPPDTGSFASFVGLHDDTLSFVPWPFYDVLGSESETEPQRLNEAVERNRRRLRRVVENWVADFPDSSTPNRALARSLELEGALEDGPPERSALAAARRARETATNWEDSLSAAVVETRVLVKLGEFDAARELAASALAWRAEPPPERARELAGMATLIGRPHRAAELLELSEPLNQNEPLDPLGQLPLPVLRLRGRLSGYTAAGAPTDSIRILASRMERALPVHAIQVVALEAQCRALWEPLVAAFPVVGLTTDDVLCRDRSYIVDMTWAAAAGDTARVMEIWEFLLRARAGGRPGELGIDGVYVESWVLLSVGDTAAAVRHLDQSLNALSTQGTYLVSEPAQAAGLVRAMALRVELAVAAGDERTARRWAEPVIALWGEARETELEEVVARMREVAGS